MNVRLRDGSGIRGYRYLWEDTDRHGNIRIYFARRGCPKIRLRGRPGTTEFEAEYRRAFAGLTLAASRVEKSAIVAPGTMQWLCQRYYASAVFAMLGDSTRKVRRGLLDGICRDRFGGRLIGTLPYATMEPRNVAQIRDAKAAFPEAANARLKALRQLFKWAMSPAYGYAKRNPAMDVPYLASKNPDGFKAWTLADVTKYEARHPLGTKARLALDLFIYTGVRRSDVVRLGPQMERDGHLVFTEVKGRERIVKTHALPILPPLRQSIDATPAGHLVYLPTQFVKPYSVKAFGNWFKRRCREAGVDANLSAHGLRKLAATICAERGATEAQLMALFGWTTAKQAALYTKKINRAKLEKQAAMLLQTGKGCFDTSRIQPPAVNEI